MTFPSSPPPSDRKSFEIDGGIVLPAGKSRQPLVSQPLVSRTPRAEYNYRRASYPSLFPGTASEPLGRVNTFSGVIPERQTEGGRSSAETLGTKRERFRARLKKLRQRFRRSGE